MGTSQVFLWLYVFKKSANRRVYSILQIFLIKVVGGFFYSRSEAVTTAIEKNPGKGPPAIEFFCSVSTLSQSGSILSCLAAEKRFFIF
jgi:hypothetical protein